MGSVVISYAHHLPGHLRQMVGQYVAVFGEGQVIRLLRLSIQATFKERISMEHQCPDALVLFRDNDIAPHPIFRLPSRLLKVKSPINRQFAIHTYLCVWNGRQVVLIGKLIRWHICAVKPTQGIYPERQVLPDASLKPLGF